MPLATTKTSVTEADNRMKLDSGHARLSLTGPLLKSVYGKV